MPTILCKHVQPTRFNSNRLVRWQQTKASGRGSGRGKLLFYTLTGAGVAVVGTIAYSSRDPEFKSTVNNYVPGFSNATDSIARQWKSIVSSKQSSEKVQLVYKTERKDPLSKINALTKPIASSTVIEEVKVDTPTAKIKKEVFTEPEITPQQPEIHEVESTSEITLTPSAEPEESTASVQPMEAPVPENTLTKPMEAPVPESTDIKTTEMIGADTEVVRDEKMSIQVCGFTLIIACIFFYYGDTIAALQPLYPVESVVESVREETDKMAEKILSEQIKDHQNSQSIGEQWMQDTAKVKHT